MPFELSNFGDAIKEKATKATEAITGAADAGKEALTSGGEALAAGGEALAESAIKKVDEMRKASRAEDRRENWNKALNLTRETPNEENTDFILNVLEKSQSQDLLESYVYVLGLERTAIRGIDVEQRTRLNNVAHKIYENTEDRAEAMHTFKSLNQKFPNVAKENYFKARAFIGAQPKIKDDFSLPSCATGISDTYQRRLSELLIDKGGTRLQFAKSFPTAETLTPENLDSLVKGIVDTTPIGTTCADLETNPFGLGLGMGILSNRNLSGKQLNDLAVHLINKIEFNPDREPNGTQDFTQLTNILHRFAKHPNLASTTAESLRFIFNNKVPHRTTKALEDAKEAAESREEDERFYAEQERSQNIS